MKPINLLLVLLNILLFSPFELSAQQSFQWQGRWEFKVSDKSFCNAHIVTSLTQGQAEPTAILEGLIYEKPFRVKCRLEEIPQRNSLVFHEMPDASGNTHYEKGKPLLVLTYVEGTNTVMPVWVQVDITKHRNNKDCLVKKVPVPNYRGTYTLNHDGTKTSLSISKVKKAGFHVKVSSGETTPVDCDCNLQSTHLAVCYPQSDKGAFYLDFNRAGVKMIQNYDDNIYNPKFVKTDEGPMVLNSTFKK